MSNACPLNFKKVDSNLSRIVALLVASLVFTYLYTLNIYILFFLAVDFIIKLFLKADFSPIIIIAKIIKIIFKIEEKYIDGGAKRLAGFFGLFFVVLLIITHFIGTWNISLIVAGVFLTCSLLDVFFDFCIGCKIYFIIKKIYPNFMNKL